MSLTLTLERGGGEISGSGTNIELDGTIAGGAIESVEMYGDTEQATYSGKNLLNITKGTFTQNGITFTQNPDGSVTMNGTSTGNAYYEMNNTAASQTTITSGVVYTLSIGDVTLPSGQVVVQIRKTNPNVVYAAVSNKSASFTAPETTTTFTYIGVYGSGVTLNNVTIYPMLEVGSSMTSFEPYVGGTASPNPDYPQEVQTVTGRQVVTITDGGNESQEYEINLGKNLFDKNAITSGYLVGRTDGVIAANVSYGASDFIRVQEGETYTFSSGFNYWYSAYYDSNKQYVGYPTNTATITIPSGVSYIRTSLLLTNLETAQFEKGSTSTTYAPYFTPIELCKIGTYQDYIYKNGGNWYVHREIKKIALNGTETYSNINSNPTSTDYYYIDTNAFDSLPNTAGYSYQLSNRFQNFDTWFIYNTAVTKEVWSFGGSAGTNRLRFMLKKTRLASATTSAVQTWFASNPTDIYYALATPTDTQITNSALIAQLEALNEATTYDGTTVITVSSENLAGSLEVTVSSNIAKTYTEVEIGSPFTIADVEGKSSNTTLDGNVYVDWAYNKKQYSFDLFNLTPQDYADIRAFYDYQFDNSAFPTITVPELNIDKLPVYMEISSRNIINQCLLTDKLTIKFRETVQP